MKMEISKDAEKPLARGKSLSVSDLVVTDVIPNLWDGSRSLFSSVISRIIRITIVDRYANVHRDHDLTIGVRTWKRKLGA
jgi:hypothetical protein